MDKYRFHGLDELRGLAVLAVMAQHWQLGTTELALGKFGVQTFFTISGFLITGILLQSRDLIRQQVLSLPQALRLFYIRRVLRIFPAYYLIVFLGVVLGLPEMRAAFAWNALYLSNILMGYVHEAWLPSYAGHFWSLSVEEQFYLVWPLVILTVSSNLLRPACLTLILISLASRYAMGHAGSSDIMIGVGTATNLDTLAIGALGAVALRKQMSSMLIMGIALAISLLGLTYCQINKDQLPGIIWLNFFIGCTALCIIGIVTSTRYPPDSVLLKPIRAIGRISYGVYLYHPYAAYLVISLLHVAGIRLFYPAQVVLFFIATLIMAQLSWTLFESRILMLKDYWASTPTTPRLARQTG